MASPPSFQRTAEQIRQEIEETLGFLPPFYEPAMAVPPVLDGLWRHTLSAYVHNPLPDLFKGRLLAFLSRYCRVPYCLVTHACELPALGMSAAEVFALLESGPPLLAQPHRALAVLTSAEPDRPWPDAGSDEEEAVFACAAIAFLGGGDAARAEAALDRALQQADRQYLTLLIGWARACHAWTEAHPALDYRRDRRADLNLGRLLEDAPGLSYFFASYGTVVADESAARERDLAAALAESRERFAQVFDRAPIGMALQTLDGRFVAVNEELCRISGYDAASVTGKTLRDVTHPDDYEQDRALIAEMIAGQRDSYTVEKRHIYGDGRVVWTEVSASIIRDPAGAPLYVVGYVQDVEKRRRAQDELRDSESRFRSAFDDALVGMGLISPDGNVRRVNATLCMMLGRSKEELMGLHFSEITHPDDLPGDGEYLRAMVTREIDGARWEKRFLHSSGRVVWVEMNASIVRDAEGEPLHFTAQMSDIGARKRADQLKDEFIATVSHELRSPLTSIQGYVELLAEEEERSEQAQHWLEVIERNSHRLRRLVDDLLFIAQARAETLAVDRVDVDLAELLGAAVEGACPRAGEIGVALKLAVEPVVVADSDADRIGQAVDNLISNALKYTPPGGRIDVRLERRGDDAAIVVADSGIGMSQQDVERLFERFFRASTAIDNAIPGVGLGLSIVKAIVDLHGGDVTVESTEGAGTTFELLLPMIAAPRPAAA
jgi:two-component system phosphate regulon sensor histidine kinase PhoR